MLSALRKFMQLESEHRKLILHATFYLVSARIYILSRDMKTLQRWTSVPTRCAYPVGRIIWAVSRAAQIVPGVTCLVKALALQRLLAMSGHQSEIKIGVSTTTKFKAHAWLCCEGDILVSDIDVGDYSITLSWTTNPKEPNKIVCI